MSIKVGRNARCPCGSGLKFKVCCLRKGEEGLRNEGSPKFRFEPGSYGGPGGYFPSIACLKQEGEDKWGYHFVLVALDRIHDDEDAAVLEAERHLSVAFHERESPPRLAECLKGFGYVSVTDFKLVTGQERTFSHGTMDSSKMGNDMTINFECRSCRREFDCDVGTIGINERTMRPDFEKPIVCPRCGERTIDQVWLTELGQSQMTEATGDLW